jgi:hypothetical protein
VYKLSTALWAIYWIGALVFFLACLGAGLYRCGRDRDKISTAIFTAFFWAFLWPLGVVPAAAYICAQKDE